LIRIATFDSVNPEPILEDIVKAGLIYGEDVVSNPEEFRSLLSDFNKYRMQYSAKHLLEKISGSASLESGDKAVGVTSRDLYVEGLNFVFGLADPRKKACIISLSRLQDMNDGLFHERVFKEVAHELGHVFGLLHCGNKTCIMNFANSIRDVDVRGTELCERCKSILGMKSRW
jgi:archaemetzincin